MNDSLRILSAILDEKWNFDVFVLVKFANLLLNDLKIIRVKLVYQQHKLSFAVINQVSGFSLLINHLQHSIKMVHCNMNCFLWVTRVNSLKLESHKHEIKQFTHTTLIKSHNTWMSQLNEYLSCFNQWVHCLWFKYFIHKLFRKHSFYNVLKYFLRAILLNHLTS